MDNSSQLTANVLDVTVTRQLKLNYLLRRPDRYEPEVEYPLVIFLHGAGQKGNDIQAVRQTPLLQVIEEGLEFPYWLVCPQCPANLSGWPVADLVILLDELVGRYSIDTNRIYLTGLSMGGRGTWEFAYDHAARLAAIVPVCSFGIPTLAPRLRELPIWIFHGEQDEIVPVARADEMADALVQSDNPARLTKLPDLGHDCGLTVYRQPELWRWLNSTRD